LANENSPKTAVKQPPSLLSKPPKFTILVPLECRFSAIDLVQL